MANSGGGRSVLGVNDAGKPSGESVAASRGLDTAEQFGIDEDPNFSYKGKFGTRQYSEAFVDWLVEQYQKDQQFFPKVREIPRSRQRAAAASTR